MLQRSGTGDEQPMQEEPGDFPAANLGMRATHAIIQSDLFPCVWSDEPDRDPPPGRDFAQALLEQFGRQGASLGKPKVEDDDWEHSSWFIWVIWQGHKYQIDIEPAPHDTTPPRWHIGIARVQGMLRAIFGSRESRFEVPDEFLRGVGTALPHIAGCEPISWITEDEAIDAL
jgi:hypothetical protein